MHKFPSWYYGPKGESAIFQSEADVPEGWQDHPSKHKGAEPAGGGVHTARAPANSTVSAAEAAKSTTAGSQTHTDPAISAKAGTTDGTTQAAPAVVPPKPETVDAHGHAYDPELHAATASQTKAGLWRMKVGVARPEPKPGYPLDL